MAELSIIYEMTVPCMKESAPCLEVYAQRALSHHFLYMKIHDVLSDLSLVHVIKFCVINFPT